MKEYAAWEVGSTRDVSGLNSLLNDGWIIERVDCTGTKLLYILYKISI